MKALLAAFVLASTPAHGFCLQLAALFDGSETMRLPDPFQAEASCTMALALTGTKSIHCAWPFDYRADTATEVFDALIRTVPDCLESASEAQRDQDVNHPDSYDLRLFESPKGEVGVSLKDKASLQETYVFLSVTPKK